MSPLQDLERAQRLEAYIRVFAYRNFIGGQRTDLRGNMQKVGKFLSGMFSFFCVLLCSLPALSEWVVLFLAPWDVFVD